jgi:hypothetical protein
MKTEKRHRRIDATPRFASWAWIRTRRNPFREKDYQHAINLQQMTGFAAPLPGPEVLIAGRDFGSAGKSAMLAQAWACRFYRLRGAAKARTLADVTACGSGARAPSLRTSHNIGLKALSSCP